MRLSNEQLINLNLMMLGMGEPIENDGQGYNQNDFYKMHQLSYCGILTDRQAYYIALTLRRYKNTQLRAYAEQIEDTISELQNAESEKKSTVIKVLSYDDNEIRFTWDYNKEVSVYIKQEINRRSYWWTKEDNQWVFHMEWQNLELVYEIFEKNGFSTQQLRSLQQEALKKQMNAINNEGSFKLNVMRLDDSIDTITASVKYHPSIVSVFKSIPSSRYIKSANCWEFGIEYSADLYNKLSALGSGIDLTELEPWKNIVEYWNQDFTAKKFTGTKFQPYQFQLDDVNTMIKARRIINGNDMGCGKTHESVRIGESLPMKKLVICPATLRLNWAAEIRMVNPDADIVVLYDASEFSTADWTIIGYPSVSKHLENLEAAGFQCIFVDEAHYCQAINNGGSPDSQRARAVLRLTATAGWVYPITGTPKTNRNKNLYNILRMIKHPLTRGNWAFHNYGVQFCDGQQGRWGWDFEGNSNDENLHDQIKGYMVRHLKSEVLPDLKKQRISIPVQVDLTEYNSVLHEYLESRTNKEAEQLARLMRARQILATQKVGETIDFARDIIENGEKVVLVTCFTEVANTLKKTFGDNALKIVGGMSDKAKNDAIEQFQTGKQQVMILNIVAGGVGITLTAAHKMIINDYSFIPGEIVQVEDRICRSGQSECCFIYYMTALGADVEEEFVDLLTYKSNTINTVVDGGEGDAIDFRSLVEKSNGLTRQIKTRKIIKEKDVKATSEEKSTHKSKTPENGRNWSEMTIQELESTAAELQVSYKKYDNPGIYRMRLIMALKKATA
jgi:SWI/SNF-related matrix-associated actin-dependent regulator 1 of chromatin subfamily A